MLLYNDINTGNVAQESTTETNSTGISIKRGSDVPISIFRRSLQTVARWPGGYYVKFVLKTAGKYEEDPPLASAVTSTTPADDASPYLLALNADTTAIRTAMLVDGNANNDPPQLDCMAAILYSPDGTDGSWVESNTFPVTLANRVSQDDDAPPAGAIATRVIWLPAVTDLVGGTSTYLDSTSTVAVGVPQAYEVTIAGVRKPYDLIASTNATSAPDWVRPTDYDGVTNPKVFRYRGAVPGSGSITYPIPVANGGTEATDAAGARTNLGIATFFQGINANLTAIAGLTLTSADRLIYTTGAGAVALATISTFGRSLIDDADAATARATLSAQASSADLSAIAALTSAADKLPYSTGSHTWALAAFTTAGRALAGAADAAAQRTALALVPGTNVQVHNSNLDGLAANTPASTVTLNNITLVCSAFTGNGAALTALNASALTSGTVPAARGGAGTVSGLLKANGSGVVTAAVPGLDYLAPGSGAGISGDTKTFTTPAVTASATTNATNLATAYTAAKALTPNGSAISSTNRARVVIPPGVYDFGATPLGLDGEFVDLSGLTGQPNDVLLTSQVSASSSGTIAKTATDVRIYGVTLQNQYTLGSPAYDATDPSAFSDLNPTGTVLENCALLSGDNGAWCMQQSIDWAGVYRRCVFGDFALGGNGGTFSGAATDCVAGLNGFASAGTFSGVATNCAAGDASFAAGGGSFTGRAYYCLSGNTGFGGGGGTLTGKLYYCRLSASTFPTVSGGGKTRYCLDGSDTANNQG